MKLGLALLLALIATPTFAKGPVDLADAKQRKKYIEDQTIHGSGSFKRLPVTERTFVLMDWQLNWDFDIREAKKHGVIGDVALNQEFFERATHEVYAQWLAIMADRGIAFRPKDDLQGLERWQKSTAKFPSVMLDQRQNSTIADVLGSGHARFMIHPDGYKPYGNGVGAVVRMTKVWNSMVKELEPEGIAYGNMSISLCMVKDKATKEKTYYPCLWHLGADGTKGQRAVASFDGFTPMLMTVTAFHRNEKYDLGAVGSIVGDGELVWGKRTDPTFLLIPREVVNAPTPEFALIGAFSEGEKPFMEAMLEVLLTADALGWEEVQGGLDAAQAKYEKKKK